MNWEAIGAVGELVGAIAVFITLLYLAIQIRQNSQAVKNSAAQTLLSEANRSLRVAASDPGTARAVILGQTLFDQLSEEERAQFIVWMFAWMRTIEQAYFQYLQGYIEEEIWEGQVVHMRQAIHSPGVSKWWNFRRCFFSQKFQKYIDEIAKFETDVSSPLQIVQELANKKGEKT